jgi:hypothetical protein
MENKIFFGVKCFGSWGKKIIVLYRGYSRRVGQIKTLVAGLLPACRVYVDKRIPDLSKAHS